MYGTKYQFILITGGPVLKHLGYVLVFLVLSLSFAVAFTVLRLCFVKETETEKSRSYCEKYPT